MDSNSFFSYLHALQLREDRDVLDYDLVIVYVIVYALEDNILLGSQSANKKTKHKLYIWATPQLIIKQT